MIVNWSVALLQPVEELPFQRDGTGWNAKGPREYVRKFLVMVTDKTLTAAEVCYAPGIPLPFAPFVSIDGKTHDIAAFNVHTSAAQPDQKDWQRWIVTCQYSTDMPAAGQGSSSQGTPAQNQGQNNPELEPPEIDWDFEVVQHALPSDLDGKAFLNSARMPFSPTPTFEQAFAVLVYSRNEMVFNRKAAAEYAFAINSDRFLGAAPGQAQCLPPKAHMVTKGQWTYWRVTYRIRFRDDEDVVEFLAGPNPLAPGFGPQTIHTKRSPRTWQPQFLDQGLCQLTPIPFSSPIGGSPLLGVVDEDSLPKEPVPIRKRNVPISQPVCLDGSGKEAKQDPKTGKVTPVWLKFRVYKEKPFAKLLMRGFV